MNPTATTYDDKYIHQALKQLALATGSELTAIGVIDRASRKFCWVTVVGSISSRTSKIRQNIQLGLIGEVLRTGSFVQLSQLSTRPRQVDEAIMLTEKLSHAAAWPLMTEGPYLHVVLIGKRNHALLEPHQINAGTKLIDELRSQLKNERMN